MSYKYFDILQTKTDSRDIKGLKLPNNINVVLISEPKSNKSSCCFGVYTGYSNDTFDGTAHFLEHLLFLGNSKYPNKNDFHSFIQHSGGVDNAYTTQSSTCYFIDINTHKMKEALEKLIWFFKDPLLDEKYIDSEKSIINSEHNKNINSDDWIISALFKKFMKNSNYKNFGTGNNSSLKNITRKDIKNFFDKYYRSENFYVCIVDKKNIQDMINDYIPLFSIIPNKPFENEEHNHYFDLKENNLIIYNSVSNYSLLNIFLIFDCDEKNMDNSQIGRYLINKMIKSKYENSLSYFLLENNLCYDMNSYVEDNYDEQVVINICIYPLNNDKKTIIKIIECVYSFIEYLKTIDEEIFKNFYNNYRNIKLLKLKYKKNSNSSNLAIETVENLMRYEKHYCLNKSFIFPDYNNELFEKYKKIINSTKMKIITNCKIKEFDEKKMKKEKYYKIKYYLTNIKIKKEKYNFSLTNFIIFKNVDKLIGGKKTNEMNVLNIDEHKKLYYTNNIFNDDFTAFTIIKKNNNLLNNENIVLFNIYVDLFYQTLKYYLEPLKDFEMTLNIKVVNDNIIYDFYGFSLLLENYIFHIFKKIQKEELLNEKNIEKTKKYFNTIVNTDLNNLQNEKFEKPYNLTLNKLDEIVYQQMSNIDKQKFIQNLTFENFINKYDELFCFQKETFISIGNINNQDLINKLSFNNKLCNNNNKITFIPKTQFHYTFKEDEILDNEKNNCICYCNTVNNVFLIYNEENIIIKNLYENEIIKNKLIYSLLSNIINEIIFDKLRTEKKLGYIVKSSFINYQTNEYNIMLIIYLIQSSKNLNYIQKNVEEFNLYLKELFETNIIEKKFNDIKEIKIKEFENKNFSNIKQQMNFYKNNIIYNYNHSNYKNLEIKILKNLKYTDIKQQIDKIINNEKSTIIYKSKNN